MDGFNTPEVKRAYRGLAKKYHPDKVRRLSDQEQEDAKEMWEDILKAYETLTDQDLFEKWLGFGGSDV